MKIKRYYANLDSYLRPNKVLVVYGARQVGKTTLLRDYLATVEGKIKYRLDSGEDISVAEVINSNSFSKIKEYVAGYDLIIIDEAQKIKNIGEGLKIIVDEIPGIKVIATGSSSFDLAGQIGEPLTGRKIVLTLFPVSQIEISNMYNNHDLRNNLPDYLIYGGYPEVVAEKNINEKKRILNEIVNSYLLKDILEMEKVKGSKVLLDLLRLLAFQVGSEVSLSEIGQQLQIDYKTVARYIDLFEKSFVLINLRGFSRNLRKEITKKSKYYFCDNGLRNAVIANFNSLEMRDDVGKLWENFLLTERIKKQNYKNIYANNYFWRTWEGQEIDFIEEREGNLFGFEFKWKEENVKIPKDWTKSYPKAEFQAVNRNNYLEFIT
jgi:uncharacterized protein